MMKASVLLCAACLVLPVAFAAGGIEGASGTGTAAVETVAEAVTTPAHVTGWVTLPGPTLQKGPGVRVLVDGEHFTYVRSNGQFHVSLLPGTHIVEFAVRGFTMPQLRIDVSRKVQGKYKAMLNDRHHSVLPSDQLTVSPLAELSYFEIHEVFNWMSILKNPMVLIMVFGLGMAFLMPQDPEMQEMRKKFLAGDFEGALSEGDQQKQVQQQPAQKKNKRVAGRH